MKKIIRLTESDLTRIVKRIVKENSYTASGYDSIGDVAHSSLKSKGHSHRGKDDEGAFYIVFDGEKFYEGDFEIAGHNDMGEIPRVEDGKLIIANPAWGS
jgi:RNA binding exosome subunit